MKCLRGSEWRKWDLHFHTPSSYDYINSAITDEDIIEGLLKAEIAAVAITDHHTIDTKRIKNLQKLANDRITIFPGIEFRSELGGSQRVHFIGIFPEDCDLDHISIQIQAIKGITSMDIVKRGIDAVYADFKDTAKIIHDLGGLVTVHAGRKSNSIEKIASIEKVSQTLRTDLAKDSIDFYEIGNVEKDIEVYRNIVFPSIEKTLPIIICSDNHDIKDYQTKMPCWVKADTTFNGLRQLLIEPYDRVFVGEEPPKYEHIANNRTKYISKIKISKNQQSRDTFEEKWFDDTIPFNYDLTAIIGNKGSGKSALADIIGLLGDSKQEQYFSFLKDDKFRHRSNNKAQHFSAQVTWEDNTTSTKKLSEFISNETVERVKYIPQNFLETICNEIDDCSNSDFNKELREVIFSHVEEDDRLWANSLDELIEYKTEVTHETINLLKAELLRINSQVIYLEETSTQEHKTGLLKHLEQKEQELKSLDSSKPTEMKKPDSDPEKQDEILELTTAIDEKNKEASELESKILQEIEKKKEQTKKLALLDKLSQRIKVFDKQYTKLKEEFTDEYSPLGFSLGDILKLKVETKPLDDAHKEYNDEKERIVKLLDETNSDGLIYKKNKIREETKELKNKLDRPNKNFQEYIKKVNEWERMRALVIGSKEATDSLEFYKNELRKLDELPKKLEETKNLRSFKVREIFAEIQQLAETYRKLYRPVQDFISNYDLSQAQANSKISFEVSIVLSNFHERFFAHISHGFSGSFYGVTEGNKLLQDIIDKYSFEDDNQILAFLDDIIESLSMDKRSDTNTKKEIKEQLLRGTSIQDLYDFLFSLEYLVPIYTLKWADKELRQLSPGEKGTLLLVFYLLIDKRDIPLLIDQPEGNLDNETVYDTLVPCIKEAKKTRQIIIVTHNPNLAVVCDAELIIYASLNIKDKNKVSYTTGSIENPSINKKILDVLEGTKPAFDNRESKYQS